MQAGSWVQCRWVYRLHSVGCYLVDCEDMIGSRKGSSRVQPEPSLTPGEQVLCVPWSSSGPAGNNGRVPKGGNVEWAGAACFAHNVSTLWRTNQASANVAFAFIEGSYVLRVVVMIQ